MAYRAKRKMNRKKPRVRIELTKKLFIIYLKMPINLLNQITLSNVALLIKYTLLII